MLRAAGVRGAPDYCEALAVLGPVPLLRAAEAVTIPRGLASRQSTGMPEHYSIVFDTSAQIGPSTILSRIESTFRERFSFASQSLTSTSLLLTHFHQPSPSLPGIREDATVVLSGEEFRGDGGRNQAFGLGAELVLVINEYATSGTD